MSIIDLQETSENVWKAKYHGNYGIYNIKIKTDGEKTVDFSCSCPSSYYPCKHIPMVEEAIRERIAKRTKSDKKNEISLEELLKDVPQKKLCDFIVKQAQYNPQIKNAILLEFAHTMTKKDVTVNNYNQLLRDALDGVYFDDEDVEYGHYEGVLDIDEIELWLNKAQQYADQNNPQEALLICKACIEEFASWCDEQDSAIIEYVKIDYHETPFEIIDQILDEIDCNELLNYCKSEMNKPKYKRTEMNNGFNNLFMELSVRIGSDDFIALQDNLLKDIDDKSSYEAKKILQRKIDFYRNNKQPEKAWEVVKNNLQIENFREELTKKLIEENNFQEAKKLINDYINNHLDKDWCLPPWYKLKLQIAQKENDISEIRTISLKFIETRFDAENYNIYKSTFTKEEWVEKVEILIKHYERRSKFNWFNSTIAQILQVEKQEERLLKYVEKYLDINIIEKYHTAFAVSFPEKTLALFRRAIDQYAENTGRTIYETIARLFEKMIKIKGGDIIVKEMISQYRIIYKSRRAMMEMLNRF